MGSVVRGNYDSCEDELETNADLNVFSGDCVLVLWATQGSWGCDREGCGQQSVRPGSCSCSDGASWLLRTRASLSASHTGLCMVCPWPSSLLLCVSQFFHAEMDVRLRAALLAWDLADVSISPVMIMGTPKNSLSHALQSTMAPVLWSSSSSVQWKFPGVFLFQR